MRACTVKCARLVWLLTLSTLPVIEARALDDPLDAWQYLNPLPTANSLNSVVFCNGQFVGTGGGPTLLSSVDGTNWVTHFVPGFFSLAHIASGNGLYVVVGSGPGTGAILTSTNLDNWTVRSSGTTNALNAIGYGNGLFVAVGNGGTLLTSTNGADWELRASGTSGRLGSIAFGNGIFVVAEGDSYWNAYSPDGAVSVSSDGITWTRQAFGTKEYIREVSFARGLFHAGGFTLNTYLSIPAPILYVSANGTNWSPLTLSSGGTSITTLFVNNTSFFATDPSGLYTSADGTNFSRTVPTNFPSASNLSPSPIAFGNGIFVSATLYAATQPGYWNLPNSGPTPDLADIAYGNGVTVAVGASILASSNGLPFANQVPPVSSALNRVVFADGLFHSVGMSGTILRSTNGVQWFQRNAGTGNNLRGLTHGNGLWVAVGDAGAITTSPTGQAWTLRFSGTSYALYGVAYGNNLFVAVGYQGTVITSSDGLNWTVQFNPSLNTLCDVTWGGSLFTAVGQNGTVITSPDGVNWDVQNSGTTNTLQAVAFDRGTFVVARNPPAYSTSPAALITSTNGINWTVRNSATPANPAASSVGLYGVRSLNGNFTCVGASGIILQNPSFGSIGLGGQWNPAQGQFEITMKGGFGQAFRLQSRDSLGATAWNDCAVFTNAPNPVIFPDPGSASLPMRFYRVAGP